MIGYLVLGWNEPRRLLWLDDVDVRRVGVFDIDGDSTTLAPVILVVGIFNARRRLRFRFDLEEYVLQWRRRTPAPRTWDAWTTDSREAATAVPKELVAAAQQAGLRLSDTSIRAEGHGCGALRQGFSAPPSRSAPL